MMVMDVIMMTNESKLCPFCAKPVQKGTINGRPAFICNRCDLYVAPITDMPDFIFEKKYRVRSNEERYCLSLNDYLNKDAGKELLKVLMDYQPCSKGEIIQRKSWLSVYLDKNISEGMDLDLIKCNEYNGETMFSLTELGRNALRGVLNEEIVC